jgi:cell fate (sporulation/competence/biofilm development) regulator YmcA (YheA/YmcA/DUF963 family)
MSIDKGEYEIEKESKHKDKIVDPQGNEIRLTARQKNEIYAKAKYLKEKVRDHLCTRKEAWEPTDYNVKKMGQELKAAPLFEDYKRHMRAIGADPRYISTERLRRSR